MNCSLARGFGAVDDCPSTVVSDDQVFVMSREDPHGDMVNNANRVVSFDLGTGKTVMKFESGSDQLLHPLRMSGDQLLAYRESGDRITPMGLTSLNPRPGKETPYFFFGTRKASGWPSAEKKKEWSWLVIGIEGAKH
ncbi:hypothetical protein [Streptomyces sp. NPDC002855]|uniref:hypothetical protein n=1 Tax=unclassified Streptomyces TaxID=2593676 RepID=UPI0033186D5D